MQENEMRRFRNEPDLRAALDELHAGLAHVSPEQSKDVHDAVAALEQELGQHKPDPARIQDLIIKLQQSGGQVANAADRLRNTTAIQTALYYAPDPDRISQEPQNT